MITSLLFLLLLKFSVATTDVLNSSTVWTSQCLDNPAFRKLGKRRLSCDWIGRTETRRTNNCHLTSIQSNCPQSCRAESCCVNDPTWTVTTDMGTEKSCKWIGDKTVRKVKYCNRINKGSLVENKCPLACGICTPMPTLSPVPSKALTSKPTKSPTPPPTHQASENPTQAPTGRPTKSISPTVEFCVDDLSFRKGGNKLKSCNWIGKLDSRRNRMCKFAFIKAACPQACRTCCGDDRSFRILTNASSLQDEKQCSWLSGNKKRKERYCFKINRGALVANKCPESCGICKSRSASPSLSFMPTISPAPQIAPSGKPTTSPSASPTAAPSSHPSSKPTTSPSPSPTNAPTSQPSPKASIAPSLSAEPTMLPTARITPRPSAQPSARPSKSPAPTPVPTCAEDPTARFFLQLNPQGTAIFQTCRWLQNRINYIASICEDNTDSYAQLGPARERCRNSCGTCDIDPSQPSFSPSATPSKLASSKPSARPSSLPSTAPFSNPSSHPSSVPSTQPTPLGSPKPSSTPTAIPTGTPSVSPSNRPTKALSSNPSASPVCSQVSTDQFFFGKNVSNGNDIFHDCAWLESRNAFRKSENCKNTASSGGIGPARVVCRATCGTC